jgi:hypothetical protein
MNADEPYILEGDALEIMKDRFELIRNLAENEDDELVFDLAWFNYTKYAEVNKQMFVDLADVRPVGLLDNGKLYLHEPYTRPQLEEFLTYLGYGSSGMGTKYTTKARATSEQAKMSYKKAMGALLEKFKRNFPQNLGHGRGKPRAATMRLRPRSLPGDFHSFRGRRFYDNNNNDDEPTQKEKRERHALGLHINNNNATHGKLAGKKTGKGVRKGLPSAKTKKLKRWSRNNNNNE